MRILAFDIGNTFTKMGTFSDGKLVKKEVKPFDHAFAALRSVNFEPPKHVVICSVTRSHHSLIQWLQSMQIPVTELTSKTPLPFKNGYGTPESLGMDRLASIAGVHSLYPEQNCLVIDCGTCIKYDMLDAKGLYHGGNIAPGLQMRIEAMHHFTAQLPVVQKVMPDDLIGKTTITALQNGAIRGAAFEIQAAIGAFKRSFGDLQVVMTGGDSEFLQQHLEIDNIALQPDLVLHGLQHIYAHMGA
jgi:type III pantothenate kinase